jgi:hypothetical protein
MKKTQGTKAPQRHTELDRIAAQVRTILRRRTRDAIEIGKLLIESRKHLEHGNWQPWLAENFDLGYRTAINYVNAAEYVARKGESIAHFANLSASVLYDLAAGHFNEREEAAILAATRERRIDYDAASAICDELAPADDDAAGDADDQDDGDEGSGAEATEDDPEIAAILDGPPPAGPPPAPIPPPPDYALHDFDQAISTLKRLMTKLPAQFATSAHDVNDLEHVQSFIGAVAKAKGRA